MPTRRRLLWTSIGLVLVGCGDDTAKDDSAAGPGPGTTGTGTRASPTDATCLTPPDGAFVEALPFVGEPPRDLETLTGDGLEGRYVLDLTTLEHAVLVVPTERFFVRTRRPATLDPTDWTIRIDGLVDTPADVPIADLLASTVDQGVVHFECSGNTAYGGFGLQSAAAFAGVPIAMVLGRVTPDPAATQVRVSGVDEHPGTDANEGASWVFPLGTLEAAGAFLATHMNGERLSDDHGFPTRLVIPGWYGCTLIKWVDAITFVDETEPATGQMQEFAGRTHQPGAPALARDYVPATIDTAALPIRVEVYRVDGRRVLWIVGLIWGGEVANPPLRIHFDGDDGAPVDVCPERTDARTWGLWAHTWEPDRRGEVVITLSVDDRAIRTRRLDEGWYARTIDLL